jgi:hypothetical protein
MSALRKWIIGGSVAVVGAVGLGLALAQEYKSGLIWPEPPVVTPAPLDNPTAPPSDAVVLFDGKDLSKWHGGDKWEIKDGYAIVKGGDIRTKDNFGDYQLHLEFATPAEVNPKQTGQGRGNSGVFLSDRYEVQVLDSYENKTYFDGQCGALYKQQPPMVNACRKPGEWQTYDIIYVAPRFDADKKLVSPGTVTVMHNGICIQNHYELKGNTFFDKPAAYTAHPVKQPIHLQNHGNPMKYRNIWLRELKPIVSTDPKKKLDKPEEKKGE